MFRKIWVLLAMCLLMSTVQAQSGRGVITIAISGSPEGLLDKQPLRCDDPQCDLLNAMLLPTLQAVDINTGRFVLADASNNGLTENIELIDEQTAVFTLRDDLTWRDGAPITAYDVYYSYLVAEPSYLRGAVPLSNQRIAFLYEQADCAALDQTQFPIVSIRSEYEEVIINFFAPRSDDDLLAQSDAWFDRDNYFRPSVTYQSLMDQDRTAGDYRFDELRPLESLRLLSVDGEQAVIFETPAPDRDRVQAFAEGDFTFLESIPLNERINLLNDDTIQTYQYPVSEGYYLRFNLTDPREPKSAFNQFGEELEQIPHPVMADHAVRQAIRVGLDIDAIIDRALNGYGIPLSGTQSPFSWARNPDLPAPVYDPGMAMQILEDAGWRDSNRDGVRECITCALAEEDAPLSFIILTTENQVETTAAQEIARQLNLLGMSVNTVPVTESILLIEIPFQDFDVYLTRETWLPAGVNDRAESFARAEDVLVSGDNDISYVNPALEALYQQARTLDGCDVDARAELYRQIDTVIAEDLPEIWLFAPTELVVVQDEVLNFAPIANHPLWNIDAWVVINQEVGG
ncbi:MAG: ABC transporter substrate-binding protein [Aggregatilineales bacterium]